MLLEGAAECMVPLLSLLGLSIKFVFDDHSVSQASYGTLSSYHGIGDFGAIPRSKHAGFADGAKGAVFAQKFVDTSGMKDVTALKLPDHGDPILVGFEADRTERLVASGNRRECVRAGRALLRWHSSRAETF